MLTRISLWWQHTVRRYRFGAARMHFEVECGNLLVKTPQQRTVTWIIVWVLALAAVPIMSTLVLMWLPDHIHLEGLVLAHAAILIPTGFAYLMAVSFRHSEFRWHFSNETGQMCCYLGRKLNLIEKHPLSDLQGFAIEHIPSTGRKQFYRYHILAQFRNESVELYRSPTATAAKRDLQNLQTWFRRMRN